MCAVHFTEAMNLKPNVYKNPDFFLWIRVILNKVSTYGPYFYKSDQRHKYWRRTTRVVIRIILSVKVICEKLPRYLLHHGPEELVSGSRCFNGLIWKVAAV